MKSLATTLIIALFAATSISAQNVAPADFSTEHRIDGKKYRVIYYERVIDKSIDEVWAEVAGNYINIGQLSKAITSSHCESGELTSGEGAERFCAIDFDGKDVEVKERILEVKETPDRKEYTYEVYESKGFPALVYNTWVVKKGANGETILGNSFTFRAKPALFTGMMGKKLIKLKADRSGVLTYKHYLETGGKNVSAEELDKLYPIKAAS